MGRGAAYAFQSGISNDQLLDDGNGRRYYGAPTADPYVAAPIQLPSGVMIYGIQLSGCVVNPGDLVMGLFDNGLAAEANVLIGTLPVSASGCFTEEAVIYPPYLYAKNDDHPLYMVIYFANNPLDGSVKFNEVEVGYQRVVSPAPATATFNDVPTTDPAFQFVEALVASGVTAGCGGGNYCPDAPLTRRQMAVFLSKALGLHWPY